MPTPPPGFQPKKAPSTLPPGFQRKGPSEEQEWGSVLQSAARNFGPSLLQLGKDTAQAILNPIDTAVAAGKMAVGGVQKAIPGEQEYEQNFDLLTDFLKDRYGSVEGFKKAVAKDPAGVLTDAATVLVPGGMALRGLSTTAKAQQLAKLGRVGRVATVAGKVGKVATKVGQYADIPAGAIKATGRIMGAVIPKGKPAQMYQQAVKFAHSIPESKKARITQFALDEAIEPTVKGIEKIQQQINLYNAQISDLIDRGVASGQQVPVKRLMHGLKEMHKRAHEIAPTESIKAQKQLKAIRDEMSEYNRRLGRGYTPAEIQKMKQKIYRNLQSYYEKVKNSPIKVQANMKIAKNAKEALEDIFPEIKQLNKNESAYIELIEALEKPVSRIKVGDVMGLGAMSKMGAGGVAAGPIGAGLGAMAAVYNSPSVKSKLAIAANKLKKQGIQINPWLEEVRLGTVGAVRAEGQEE